MIKKNLLNNIHFVIFALYLIFFSKLFSVCYNIVDFGFVTLIIIYFFSISVYLLYTKLLKKLKYKIISILVPLILIILSQLRGIIDLKKILNVNYIANYAYIKNSYYYSLPIELKSFIPFLIILIPLTCCISFSLRERLPFITFLFSAPLMWALWYNGLDLKIYMIIYVILSSFDFGINMYLFSLRNASKKEYKINVPRKNVFTYLFLMVLAIVIFVTFSGEFFGIRSISEINTDRLRRLISDTNSSENSYELSNSGYGENSYILGGPIKLNNMLALKVKCDRPMYLRGNALNFYDGFGWRKYLTYRLSANRNTEISNNTGKLEVVATNVITSTFFTPINTLNVISSGNYIEKNESNIYIIANKKNINTNYLVQYDKNIQPSNLYVKYENSDILYDKEVRQPYINYLQLPNTITPETYTLIADIVKNCKTNTEKLYAIQEYLTNNYQYSLSVAKIPKNKDFLHYFLFNEKKGYCTYFATAATIFARVAGIPARYVEGFSMDDTKDGDGSYLVGNNRAHAWAEVLTSAKDDSWGIFECTPSYSTVGNEKQFVVIPKTVTKSTPILKIESVLIPSKDLGQITMSKKNLLILMIFISIGGLVLLACFILIKLRKILRIQNKILSSKGIIPLYYYSQERLSHVGIKWQNGLSDEENVLALKDEVLRIHFIKIVNIFYDEYYGGKVSEDFNKKEFYNYLESYIHKNSNFIKYYFIRLKQ